MHAKHSIPRPRRRRDTRWADALRLALWMTVAAVAAVVVLARAIGATWVVVGVVCVASTLAWRLPDPEASLRPAPLRRR